MDNWITSAAVATIIGVVATLITNYVIESKKIRQSKHLEASKMSQVDDWENIKLDREILRVEIGNYLAADSERWRHMANRSGALKDARRTNSTPNEEAINQAIAAAESARERMWAAYSRIQLVAPDAIVNLTLNCIGISDDRNRSFKDLAKSPSGDTRKDALKDLVSKTRTYFGLDFMNVEVATTDSDEIRVEN